MDFTACIQAAAAAAPAEASKPAIADPKAFGGKTRAHANMIFKDLDAHSSLQIYVGLRLCEPVR